MNAVVTEFSVLNGSLTKLSEGNISRCTSTINIHIQLSLKDFKYVINIIIFSVHFPPPTNVSTFRAEINKVLKFFEGRPNVLAGDFNARRQTWGDTINSPRDRALSELLSGTVPNS